MCVIGPEGPLVDGWADRFWEQGMSVFGPFKLAARLEGSKLFAKNFMKKYNIPTGDFNFSGYAGRLSIMADYMRIYKGGAVIKVDGLAAGKGVFVCNTKEETEEAFQKIYSTEELKKAASVVLIEEMFVGQETPMYMPSEFLIGHNMKVYEQQRPLLKKNAGAYGRELRYWIDGHNFNEILNSIHYFKHRKDKSKPLAVIAHTIKCKGVEDWEGCVESHGKALPPKMYKKAWHIFDREIMRLKLATSPPHMQLPVKPYE